MPGAAVLAEQIRIELSANELKDRSNKQNYGRITLSIGVAQYRNGETPDALIGRVDKALYKAKQYGRDRVVKADRPWHPNPTHIRIHTHRRCTAPRL